MAKPRKPLLVNVALSTALLLPIVYVLSYAPALKAASSEPDDQPYKVIATPHLPGYGPVEWLIDYTPLREPLFWWARLFDAEEDCDIAAAFR